MGTTIHYADGTVEQSPHDHDTDEPDHDHDAVAIEGKFGDYYRCTDCGVEAVEGHLKHLDCE